MKTVNNFYFALKFRAKRGKNELVVPRCTFFPVRFEQKQRFEFVRMSIFLLFLEEY